MARGETSGLAREDFETYFDIGGLKLGYHFGTVDWHRLAIDHPASACLAGEPHPCVGTMSCYCYICFVRRFDLTPTVPIL